MNNSPRAVPRRGSSLLARPVEPFEGQRGDVLGGGAVAEHRYRVRVDVTGAAAKQGVEVGGVACDRRRHPLVGLGACFPYTPNTSGAAPSSHLPQALGRVRPCVAR